MPMIDRTTHPGDFPANVLKALPLKEARMDQQKPGWKTTEYWLSAAATLLGLLVASEAIPEGSPWAKVVAMAISILAALGYTAARSVVKATEAKGKALVEIAKQNPPQPPAAP